VAASRFFVEIAEAVVLTLTGVPAFVGAEEEAFVPITI
jgi:hypothetical protein